MGCGPVLDDDPSSSTSGTGSSTAADPSAPDSGVPTSPGGVSGPGPQTASDTVTETGATAETGVEVTTEGDSGSDDGGTFVVDPTVGCDEAPPEGVLYHCTIRCSVWYQDCPDGERCVPWSNDGSEVWNASRCVAVSPEPTGVGEVCTIEGSPASGLDSCEVGAMCWGVDPDTLQGECVSLCTGSAAEPICAAGRECVNMNDGTVPLCLPQCDPLEPSCDAGEGCYPNAEGTWVCLATGTPVEVGGFPIATCPSGSFGLPPDLVSGCEDDVCCVSVCNVNDPESGCEPHESCESYYPEPGVPDVPPNPLGFCFPV